MLRSKTMNGRKTHRGRQGSLPARCKDEGISGVLAGWAEQDVDAARSHVFLLTSEESKRRALEAIS